MAINVKKFFDPTIVMYLVYPNWDQFMYRDDMLKVKGDAFQRFVQESVHSYVQGDKLDPAIQTSIMNIADDVLAGREATIRAGDYIALMGYAKKNKKV
ncbi:MAG: hypothetical protein ABSC11_02350 [Smithella sp.]|jgi:hypothetical protein